MKINVNSCNDSQFTKNWNGFTNKHLKPCEIKFLIPSSITFVILLLCTFSLPPSISCENADHFQAKSSLDSDENIGKSIDQWPSSDLVNSTLPENLDNSQEIENFNISTPTNSSSKILTEEEEEEEEWRDENQARRSHTRVAAVAVYGSVILIALFGVLIKYFVTQYETLQAKAQLEYQQLRNVQCH